MKLSEELRNKGKLLDSEWDKFTRYEPCQFCSGCHEVEEISLSEIYLYKGVEYYIDYEYQITTKENFDYKKIAAIGENDGWN